MTPAEILKRATTEGVQQDRQNLDDLIFMVRVTSVMVGSLEKALGIRATLDLEDYLNKQGTSLWNVCEEAEKVSEVLCYLFNKDGASFLVQTMIKHALQSYGIKLGGVHSGFASLKDALDAIRIISGELASLKSSEEWSQR